MKWFALIELSKSIILKGLWRAVDFFEHFRRLGNSLPDKLGQTKSETGPAQISLTTTSILPRVALEYGQVWCPALRGHQGFPPLLFNTLEGRAAPQNSRFLSRIGSEGAEADDG